MKNKITKNRNLYKICLPLFGAKYHGGIRIIFKIAEKLALDGLKVQILCPKNSWSPIYQLNPDIEVTLLETKNIFSFSFRLMMYFATEKNCIFLL